MTHCASDEWLPASICPLSISHTLDAALGKLPSSHLVCLDGHEEPCTGRCCGVAAPRQPAQVKVEPNAKIMAAADTHCAQAAFHGSSGAELHDGMHRIWINFSRDFSQTPPAVDYPSSVPKQALLYGKQNFRSPYPGESIKQKKQIIQKSVF